MIQDQYEEIFEVIFIIQGSVGVGYRLFNEIFYGMRIVMIKDKKIVSPINDYSCLYNKCSEFLYKPIDYVEALAIRKENFNTLMEDPMAKRIKSNITRSYKYVIQEPMHEHRDEMASKFENRIDYVDISAYGIGKIKVHNQIKKEKKLLDNDIDGVEEETMHNASNPNARIFKKVAQFESKVTSICYSLGAFAER